MISNILLSWEINFYLFIWCGSIIYAIYNVTKCRAFFYHYDDVYGDFKESWLLPGIKKDASDLEWHSFLTYLGDVYPWVLVSLIVTECFRKNKCSKLLDCWQVILTSLFITYEIGALFLIIVFAQPLLFEIVSRFRSKTALWLCNAVCLYFINNLKNSNGLFTMLEVDQVHQHLIITSVGWLNLRCLGHYIDNINEIRTKNVWYYCDVLAYMLYFPTFFVGPFLFYSEFKKGKKFSDDIPKIRERLKLLTCNLFRFTFWLFFTDLFLHMVYVNALAYQPELVKTFNTWTLYGYGYSMGQYFHLKYVVMYGLSTTIARFEGISPPNIPKCIGSIHLYSDMWKYFDCNLYKFLVCYIYVPTLKKRTIIYKMFSSLLTFTFVYVWHGNDYFILVWATLNFIGLTLESLCKHSYLTYGMYFKSFNSLSRQWQTRLTCALSSPLLALSAISNFYFFAGETIGNMFFTKFFEDSLFTNIIVLFVLYTCCVVSSELKLQNVSKNKSL